MKTKKKNIIISATAVGLAGVLAVGALLQTSVSVAASDKMMPGIETIVNNTSKEDPLKILEIVDAVNEAEIGYYVSGQEPFLKLYEYITKDKDGNEIKRKFSTVEEGLSVLPTIEERRAFVENSPKEEDGISQFKDIRELCIEGNGDVEASPLFYQPYQELYFLTDAEDGAWKEIKFENGTPRTVELHGHYEQVNPGEGDYTKNEVTYYPVRVDGNEPLPTDADKAKYRENIEGFAYSGENEQPSNPYQVTFTPVVDTAGNPIVTFGDGQVAAAYDYPNGQYGYYENVYRELTDSTDFNKFPGVKSFSAEAVNTAGTEDFQSEFQSEFQSSGEFGDMEVFQASPEFGDESATDSGGDTVSDPALQVSDDNPMIYRAEVLDQYPNYRYTEFKTLNEIKQDAQPEDETDVKLGDGAITKDANGVYKLWSKDTNGNLMGEYLYYIQGRQQVAMENVRNLPEDYYGSPENQFESADIAAADSPKILPYYYQAAQADFSCQADSTVEDYADIPTAFSYTGWYYAFTPANEEPYVEAAENENATYYTSEEEYTLKPGQGDYRFVPGTEEDPMVKVQVDHLYYQGGYTNNDWLKRYVFNLSPSEASAEQVFEADPEAAAGEDNGEGTSQASAKEQFDNFAIQVDTLTVDEFSNKYNTAAANDSPENTLQSPNGEQQFTDDRTDIFQEDRTDTETFDESQEDTAPEQEPAEDTAPEQEPAEDTAPEQDGGADNSADGDIQTQAADYGEGQESQVAPLVSETEENLTAFGDSVEDTGEAPAEADAWSDGNGDANGSSPEDGNSDELPAFQSDPQDEIFSSNEDVLFTSGEKETEASALAEYDLIYINGKLSQTSAELIAKSKIPCIINQAKAQGKEDGNGIREAFKDFIPEPDSDEKVPDTYVNQYVYFFKNPTPDTESPFDLLNLNFHTPFYDGDTNSASENGEFTSDVPSGFKEILDYIESENQYREVANSGQPDEGKTNLLSAKIFQARVIEYILNYAHKRIVEAKGEINVLEIQPAKSDGQITETEVRKWLGYEVESPDLKLENPKVCCANGDKTAVNILNPSGSPWVAGLSLQHTGNHYFTVTLSKKTGDTVSGIVYQKREDGWTRGVAKKFRVALLNAEGEEIYSEEGKLKNISGEQKFSLKKTVSGVNKVKFEIIESYTSKAETNPKDASCGEFGVFVGPQVNITTMTSSEFVGHIDDINTKYDMIYIGNDAANRTELINGDDGMLYTHVGGEVKATDGQIKFLGLMNDDYSGKYDDDRKQYIKGTEYYQSGGTGTFRGSGNDITQQQVNELMEFVNSGYPVVISDGLLTNNQQVNTDYVDGSSYFYKFLSQSIFEHINVITKTQAEAKQGIQFLVNIEKPKITFSSNTKEPPRLNQADFSDGSSEEYAYMGPTEEGLEYEFTLSNNSEISQANTTYHCELYIDLDFDGNFAKDENQSRYIEVYEENGSNLSSVPLVDERYQLKLDKKYIVKRKVPANYYKLISWKLVVSSNYNNSVRVSEVGYAKREVSSDIAERQNLNVLQIRPNSGGMWDLSFDENTNDTGGTSFQDLMARVPDFNITIDSWSVAKFAIEYKKDNNLLNGYDMLIIGFDDVYENIPNVPYDSYVVPKDHSAEKDKDGNEIKVGQEIGAEPNFKGTGAVDAIFNFIKDGKSVLFSHDTTSFVNIDITKTNNILAYQKSGSTQRFEDTFLTQKVERPDWGYSINSKLRPVVGMDRYGITNKTAVGSKTVSDELKEDKPLDLSDPIASGIQKIVGDMAYSGTLQGTYPQTQGYSNGQLDGTGGGKVKKAAKVNDGAITQYPYYIGDTITTADTHAQYYQLAMEEDADDDKKNDIVVWYCLDDSPYNNSPKDVRNNYYFYSKGNVIYTGVGHSAVEGKDNLQEKQFFVNAIIAAANVSAVKPDVQFLQSFDPTAEIERTRYYMTDQSSWNEDIGDNTLEKNMAFHFRVREYNMVASSLNPEEDLKQDIAIKLYIESNSENSNPIDVGEGGSINVVPLDDVKSLTLLSSKVPIGKKIEDGAFHLSSNDTLSFNIVDIEQYLKQTGGGYMANCRLIAEVTSTVTLYNKPNVQRSYAVLNLKQRQLFELD